MLISERDSCAIALTPKRSATPAIFDRHLGRPRQAEDNVLRAVAEVIITVHNGFRWVSPHQLAGRELRLAAHESRCVRFVNTLALEGLQSNCHAVFRHLKACLTRPPEHVRTHVSEHHALCAALWQLRS